LQVGTSASNGNGAYLTAGGVWTNASDVNLKENFSELNNEEVLKKISLLPVTQWNYKGTRKIETHIGPMAQDFKMQFGLGVEGDDKAISTMDISGVTLAGVKGLIKKNEELEKKLADQQRLIEEMIKELDRLKTIIR